SLVRLDEIVAVQDLRDALVVGAIRRDAEDSAAARDVLAVVALVLVRRRSEEPIHEAWRPVAGRPCHRRLVADADVVGRDAGRFHVSPRRLGRRPRLENRHKNLSSHCCPPHAPEPRAEPNRGGKSAVPIARRPLLPAPRFKRPARDKPCRCAAIRCDHSRITLYGASKGVAPARRPGTARTQPAGAKRRLGVTLLLLLMRSAV